MKNVVLVFLLFVLSVNSWGQVKDPGLYNESDFYKMHKPQLLDIQGWFSSPDGYLYVEGRYGYEDPNTGAMFLGWNVPVIGDDLKLTPMIGFLAGNINGLAPALTFESDIGEFKFESENEYVNYYSDRRQNFFYDWSKASYRFIHDTNGRGETTFGLSIGIGVQYQTPPQNTFYLGPMIRVNIGNLFAIDYFTYRDIINKSRVFTIAVDLESDN
jgi:hypothetical protein